MFENEYIENYFSEEVINQAIGRSDSLVSLQNNLKDAALDAVRKGFDAFLADASFGCEFNDKTKEFEFSCYLSANGGESAVKARESLESLFETSSFYDSIEDMESASSAIKYGRYFREISEKLYKRARDIRTENET